MEVNEQLVRAVTQAVVAQLMVSGAQPQNVSSTPAPAPRQTARRSGCIPD